MCAVRGIELLQDAANVHLDRAFLHVQPGGDQLIGLALAQEIDYRKLARREVQSVRSPLPFTFRLVIRLCGCRAQRMRRNKGATRTDKLERSDSNFASNRCRDVAAHAMRQSAVDFVNIVSVGKHNGPGLGEPHPQKLKLASYVCAR